MRNKINTDIKSKDKRGKSEDTGEELKWLFSFIFALLSSLKVHLKSGFNPGFFNPRGI